MIRTRIIIASAAVGAITLAMVGLAVAKADNLLSLSKPPGEAAVYCSRNSPTEDRLIAKAAFTTVLAHGAQPLGMIPRQDEPRYAPVYPNGLILEENPSPADASVSMQYDAPAPQRALLDFYEDAAALAHMPFKVAAIGPDTLLFQARQGPHRVQAKLTRQFANGTVVDLSYS